MTRSLDPYGAIDRQRQPHGYVEHLEARGRTPAQRRLRRRFLRFAQIGRYPRQHEEHSWPSERYPFTFTPVPDPFSGKLDSVLKRPDTDPLVIHSHTAGEYWERHGSMTHTDQRDGSDVEIPANVRARPMLRSQATTPVGSANCRRTISRRSHFCGRALR